MKKFNKYIFSLAALAFAFTACVEEQEYEKGAADLEGCYGVYFPTQEATGNHTFDPTKAAEIVFTVARKNSEGDITVPVKHTASHEGVFQLGELVFADGQTESTLKVTFPDSEIGVTYKLHLSIEDPQYASKYNDADTHIDFSVLRVEWKYILNPQTNEPAKFTFTQTWWEEEHTGKVKYYEVDGVRTCATETDPMTYSDGSVGYGFWGTAAKEGEGELSFNWYTNVKVDEEETLDAVWLKPSMVYVHSEIAEVYCWDWYSWWTICVPQDALAGMDFPTFAKKLNSTYPVSTYSNGLFSFTTAHYRNMETYGWAGMSNDIILDAEGFVRTDYSLSMVAGQATDGVLPVLFTYGTDVASVKYASFEGELYAAQVTKYAKGITDGSIESFEITSDELDLSPVLDLSFDKTGVYTLVAVSFDSKGAAQKTASVSFGYVAADDEVPVVLSAGLGSAAKYGPLGVNTDNALEYFIYGKDLTELQMGVFSALDIDKDAEACVSKVLNSTPVSDSLLTVINGLGHVSVVTGLNPGTEYHLLVVATNGYETKVHVSDGQFTTGNPHPVYMSFTSADFSEDLVPTTSEGYFGKYNLYAKVVVDDEGNKSPTRVYCGQVEIADSMQEDIPADSYGLVTEYVTVTGLFPAMVELGAESDAAEFEYYGGCLYNLEQDLPSFSYSGQTVDVVLHGYDGKYYYNESSYMIFGAFVKEGYIAFVNTSDSPCVGIQAIGYIGGQAAMSVGEYENMLLVDPAKDDSGLAPEEDAPSTSQLKQISNTLRQGPTNYVETPRGNIRSIIDKARQTPTLRGQFTGIQGERDAKAVSFSSEFSSDKVQKFSKNDPYTKVANISLR